MHCGRNQADGKCVSTFDDFPPRIHLMSSLRQTALALSALLAVTTPALADFTMISGFDRDITTAVANGAEVEVDPEAERPFIRVV